MMQYTSKYSGSRPSYEPSTTTKVCPSIESLIVPQAANGRSCIVAGPISHEAGSSAAGRKMKVVVSFLNIFMLVPPITIAKVELTLAKQCEDLPAGIRGPYFDSPSLGLIISVDLNEAVT